ncbi:MAG: hypothetical protein AAFY81_06045, partial [Pseudomonadota bacterium]
SLMLQFAARELGHNRLRRFEFRGMSPAIVGEALILVFRGVDEGFEMAAVAADGRQVTKARARV